MKKSCSVGTIKRKVVRGDDPIEYFLTTVAISILWVTEEVVELNSLRMKRFLKKKKIEGKKDSVLLSVEEKQIGGA